MASFSVVNLSNSKENFSKASYFENISLLNLATMEEDPKYCCLVILNNEDLGLYHIN